MPVPKKAKYLENSDMTNRLGGVEPPTQFPRFRVSEESMSSINFHNCSHTEYNFNII